MTPDHGAADRAISVGWNRIPSYLSSRYELRAAYSRADSSFFAWGLALMAAFLPPLGLLAIAFGVRSGARGNARGWIAVVAAIGFSILGVKLWAMLYGGSAVNVVSY